MAETCHAKNSQIHISKQGPKQSLSLEHACQSNNILERHHGRGLQPSLERPFKGELDQYYVSLPLSPSWSPS